LRVKIINIYGHTASPDEYPELVAEYTAVVPFERTIEPVLVPGEADKSE
jgi:hypothetical protein